MYCQVKYQSEAGDAHIWSVDTGQFRVLDAVMVEVRFSYVPADPDPVHRRGIAVAWKQLAATGTKTKEMYLPRPCHSKADEL